VLDAVASYGNNSLHFTQTKLWKKMFVLPQDEQLRLAHVGRSWKYKT